MGQTPYVLLNQLVTVTLNPEHWNGSDLSDQNAKSIQTSILEEVQRIKNDVTNLVFRQVKERNIQEIVNQHHDFGVSLLKDAFFQTAKIPDDAKWFKCAHDFLIKCIDDLLSFLELRFNRYIKRDCFVPVTYLQVVRTDLGEAVAGFRENFVSRIQDTELTDIVLSAIDNFINRPIKVEVAYQDVIYMKELVKELECLDEPLKNYCVYTALNELLINLDFNCTRYVNHFTQRVSDRLKSVNALNEKIELLLTLHKEFKEMHVRGDLRLFRNFNGIKWYVNDWFEKELVHYQMELTEIINFGSVGQLKDSSTIHENNKLEVNLAADQISIFLRAISEEQVVSTASTSALYRIIVRCISSKGRKSLSWKSMRGKNNEFELRDRESVIMLLNRLIERIKTF